MPETNCVIKVNSTSEYDRLCASSSKLGQLSDEGGRALNQFPHLLQDVFYALYEGNPQFLSSDLVSTSGKLNRLIVDELMKSWEFRRTRKLARDNLLGAGMIAMYFAELVLNSLDHSIIDTANEITGTEEELNDALTQKRVVQKILAVAGEIREQGIAGHNQAGDLIGAYCASLGYLDQFIEEKRTMLKSLSARLSMQWNTSGRKKVGRPGTGEEGSKQGKFETGAEGLGDNKGVWTRGDLTSHLKLMETYLNSPKLKRLALRIGRLKEVRENRQGRSWADDVAEVRGIAYGNDLAMVVPEEWADYFHPGRKTGFKKRFAEENLCIYDASGKRPKGRGSLIICIDNSGSMQGPKEETSKAIAVALMEIGLAQKRDMVVIMFGGPDDEMQVFEFPKGQCTFEQLVQVGEYFLCSAGTDFEKPLGEAVKFLEKDKYPGGDIVFITDGVCHISSEFLERYRLQKRAKHFQTIAVLVNYGQVPTAPVEAFCDELLLSKDLKGEDIAPRLFGQIRG